MKLRVLKEADYNKIVVRVYKISNDDKQNRIYLFHRIKTRFNSNSVNPVYHDKLLVDLNIYEEVNKQVDHQHSILHTVDTKEIIELDVMIHEALLGSFFL